MVQILNANNTIITQYDCHALLLFVSQQQQVGSGGGGGVVSLNKKQPQRRMNLTRLVRAMVSQQQTMLEQLEKLFTALEQSTAKMAALAEEAIAARQPEAGVLALLMD